jgi:hypothetical protein
MVLAPPVNVHEDRIDQEVEIDGTWVGEPELVLTPVLWGASFGAPSLSVPIGPARGLPMGVIVQGTPCVDPAILGLGVAIEELLGRIDPTPDRRATAALLRSTVPPGASVSRRRRHRRLPGHAQELGQVVGHDRPRILL